MPPFWLRMAMWARNPPGRNQRIAVAVILGIGLSFAAIEYFIGWPDWLTAERMRRPGLN